MYGGENVLQLAWHLHVVEHVGCGRAALQQVEISLDHAHREKPDLRLLDVLADGRGAGVDRRGVGGEAVCRVESVGEQNQHFFHVGAHRLRRKPVRSPPREIAMVIARLTGWFGKYRSDSTESKSLRGNLLQCA